MSEPARPDAFEDSSAASAAPESTTHADERPRQHKRTRAAMDPGTPKGEEGEPRGLASSTPVAKKGRVEDEDEGSPPGSDADHSGRTTPPTTTADAPTTPASAATTTSKVPGTEGKETKHIRERVAAMKASNAGDDKAMANAPATTSERTAADTAAEVSVSAAKLGDEHDAKEAQDVEIASVAAEVAKSAEMVNGASGQAKEGTETEMKTQEAKVADEVSKVAQKIEREDEVIAETAAETATAAASVPEAEKPASAPKSTSFVPYTGAGSGSTSSSFSAFSSSSSPFASVSTPAKLAAAPAPSDQKPKTKTAFSASPFLASSIPLARKPDPATSEVPSNSSPTTPAVAAAPSTPASKPLAVNSPFSAFASTSGFASAAKKPSALSTGSGAFGTPVAARSAFSSYSAAPSAFASVPSTPSAKSPLPPSRLSDDATTASTGLRAATAEGVAETGASGNNGSAAGDGGRKIGEPEEPDETKRIYTEQETHTGEEGDKVVHNVRAKLFAMQDGNWVERGMGPLKVNLTKRDGEKDGARIVMRADATHRLLLNSPLFKEFFIEVSNEKYVRFTIIEGSEPISYMARLGNPAAAEALVAAIRERTSAL